MDETSFLLNTLDSQVRILCETVSNHLRFLVDSASLDTTDHRNHSKNNSGSVIITNMKSIVDRQGLAARNSIRYLDGRLSNYFDERDALVRESLNFESRLRDRLEILRSQVQQAGINRMEGDIPLPPSNTLPHPGGDFDEDLQSLIHVRDQLIQNIQRVDAIHELKQSS